MSLQIALEELVKEKERTAHRVDVIAKELEELQNLLADINLSISTLQKIIENHAHVGKKTETVDADKYSEADSATDDSEYQRLLREAEEEKRQKEKYPEVPKKEFDITPPQKILNDKFHCDACHCDFLDQEALDNHNRDHHTPKPKGTTPWRINAGKPVCIHCKGRKKHFDSMQNLEDHIALKHPEHLEAFQKYATQGTTS